MPASQTGDATAFALPLLDKPCPDCTTEDAQKLRAAAYKAWSDEECAAYEKFGATHKLPFEVAEAWKRSDTYRELMDRQPEPAGVGCVECDWKQRVLTDAGRQVLAFIDFWRSAK